MFNDIIKALEGLGEQFKDKLWAAANSLNILLFTDEGCWFCKGASRITGNAYTDLFVAGRATSYKSKIDLTEFDFCPFCGREIKTHEQRDEVEDVQEEEEWDI